MDAMAMAIAPDRNALSEECAAVKEYRVEFSKWNVRRDSRDKIA